MILQRNCFSSVIVQLSHFYTCLTLTSHLCYFMSSVVCFFFSLGIAMSLLLVSKNSFMAKDVNCLSCHANEILYFIVSNLLWCFVFCLYIFLI